MVCDFSKPYSGTLPIDFMDYSPINGDSSKCQFREDQLAFFDGHFSPSLKVDGQSWCPYHFPLQDKNRNPTPKAGWDNQALIPQFFYGNLMQDALRFPLDGNHWAIKKQREGSLCKYFLLRSP
jgi:hypothetical protein